VADFPARPEPPLPLAISECLLGNEVRYDGSGARSFFPHPALEGLFSYQGICPEVGIGMGVPRPPIRLVAREVIRAVGVADAQQDYTGRLIDFGQAATRRLGDVAGYVFMQNSPSCGLFRVKVYPEENGRVNGPPGRYGRGIYAGVLAEALSEMPMEESGRLQDVVLRENFVTRAFAYAHWRSMVRLGLDRGRLIEFHSRYKYLLMAHSVPRYQQADRLMADGRLLAGSSLAQKAAAYIANLMTGLAIPVSRGGHANVLAHLQGHLKRELDRPSRRELAELITGYRNGEQPLQDLMARLKHHLRPHRDLYQCYQAYLEPLP